MDIPIRGKHVGIIINRKRYRCCVCRHALFEPVPHINEHLSMTHHLVNYITFPRLETVYHFKESLYDIYEAETKEIALLFHSLTPPDYRVQFYANHEHFLVIYLCC